MPRKPEPLPTPVFYGRSVGNIQWMCPQCGYMNGSEKAPWRKARLQCGRYECRATYRVGIAIVEQVTFPYVAYYRDPPWNGYTVNVIVPRFEGHNAIARWVGSVEYSCPTCHSAQRQTVSWGNGQVTCDICSTQLLLRVILYKSTQKHPVLCPIDWIGSPYAQEPHSQPLHAASANQI
jgi:ssDNA-binding Zn-finger/Zn-ribbon topoisomerase 1